MGFEQGLILQNDPRGEIHSRQIPGPLMCLSPGLYTDGGWKELSAGVIGSDGWDADMGKRMREMSQAL